MKGGGDEDAEERPVLTVRQVFDLAERIGRRPVGNIRKVRDGYRLRFRRYGEMRTSPERYATRQEAQRALWKMADDGRADCTHDRRFRALVLLAAFASLRWGEATALRRSDLDLEARTVRIRATFVERSTGELLLGPPKSRAGRRIVGIPAAIIPDLQEHLAIYVKDEPGALIFPNMSGGHCGVATSARCRLGRKWSGRWACQGCTSTTFATLATSSPPTAARAFVT
jgi:integrase